MTSLILDNLANLEAQHDIQVLYAVESGSRAWGFASPDSDYDIRFIYRHPIDWYLSVQKRRDVVEAMVDPELDFAGWDLPKALMLLRKSNPSLIEWLGSPIVYAEDSAFMDEFRELAGRCLSLNACLYHYLHTAEANWKSYFSSDSESVKLKKYFYILRPLYACRWIERHHSVPPVAFARLLEGASEPGPVADELFKLLEAKAITSEIGLGTRNSVLDAFITVELQRINDITLTTAEPVGVEELDAFFRKHIGFQANG